MKAAINPTTFKRGRQPHGSIYQELINSTPPAPVTSGLMARVGKLWGKREDTKHTPVRGLYMWGGVGRGKTRLMDLFYQSLPGERKQRLHFHRFMLRVHEELTALQGQTDPLEIIADRFKAETDVLCFDEFLFLILPMPCYLAV